MDNQLESWSRIKKAELDAAEIVFDLDGTLVKGDLGETVFFHVLLGKSIVGNNLEIGPESRNIVELSGGRDQLLEEYFSLARTRQHLKASKFLAKFIAKLPAIEIERITGSVLQQNGPMKFIEHPLKGSETTLKIRYGVELQKELIELMKKFRELGARTWVVSASPQPIVEVFGSLIDMASQQILAVKVDPQCDQFVRVPYGKGKASALEVAGIENPLVVFGNSMGDLEMLERARFPVVMENSYHDLLEIAHYRGWAIYEKGIGFELI